MKNALISNLLCLLLTSFWCGSVVADEETARSEFRRGQALFDTGDPAAAAVAFRAAHSASPNWRLYYNIGQSESAARDFGAALEAFQLYFALGGDEVARVGRRKWCPRSIGCCDWWGIFR
jgi:tetratricopeptide (TPR) repeat protein